MEACENNHMDAVLYLLKAGASATHKVNLTWPNLNGMATLLCYTTVEQQHLRLESW